MHLNYPTVLLLFARWGRGLWDFCRIGCLCFFFCSTVSSSCSPSIFVIVSGLGLETRTFYYWVLSHKSSPWFHLKKSDMPIWQGRLASAAIRNIPQILVAVKNVFTACYMSMVGQLEALVHSVSQQNPDLQSNHYLTHCCHLSWQQEIWWIVLSLLNFLLVLHWPKQVS